MNRSYKIILGLVISIIVVMAVLVFDRSLKGVLSAAPIGTASVIRQKSSQKESAKETEMATTEAKKSDVIRHGTKANEAETNAEGVVASETTENVTNEEQNTSDNGHRFASLKEKDLYYFKEIESLYHSGQDTYNYTEFDMTELKKKIPNAGYFRQEMILCGDSYCGLLIEYIEKKKYYAGKINAKAGKSIIANKDLYIKTINSDESIVVLSTSVNDVIEQTSLKDFKDTIEELFTLAYEKGKILVVHTNCDFYANDTVSANNSLKFDLAPKYYDWIIITSAAKYGNVVYVDCNDIMLKEYLLDDGIHYNEKFYNILIDRIYHDLQVKFGYE